MSGKPLEVARRPFQTGPSFLKQQVGTRRQFAGRTTLNSGSASVTVSTAVVNSDSIIMYGIQASSVGAQNSAFNIVVNSIVSGVSFAFARILGAGGPDNSTIMWEIKKTS